MDDTRLGKINDRINEESYFYYISVARGKGIGMIIAHSEKLYPRLQGSVYKYKQLARMSGDIMYKLRILA